MSGVGSTEPPGSGGAGFAGAGAGHERRRLDGAGMSLPGGIRLKLTLALVTIVGGALFAAYMIVVPSLERRLVGAKLEQLQVNANTIAADIAGSDLYSDPTRFDEGIRTYGSLFGARVVVFSVFRAQGKLVLTTYSDSAAIDSDGITKDTVALETARTGPVRRRVRRGGEEYAEAAARILPTNGVVLISASLSDQLATVRLVERRMFYATAVGLATALVLGFVAATLHARRIRGLQRAADRIAQGHFDEPIIDAGDDELGQLATAFDRMRVQVAQLDSARKEFVANASHELRTPLFSLPGVLELLADEELDEATGREFLETTRSQVDRLTTLATDLLDLSRMDAGRLRVESEEVDLADTVRVLAAELHALADATEHRLETEVDADVWARADEERVVQIGRALARNAFVHTPPGTRVVLRAARSDTVALLAVEDDGPGIPPEHLERIFHRFYRVEGGHASGSGLGLAIARELASLMGGTVAVESRPGRTAFVLTLPGEPISAASPVPS
jgi:two-component system OmpR family sensor kinase